MLSLTHPHRFASRIIPLIVLAIGLAVFAVPAPVAHAAATWTN